jgi:hypothetical protein
MAAEVRLPSRVREDQAGESFKGYVLSRAVARKLGYT